MSAALLTAACGPSLVHLPPGLRAVGLRAFSSPVLTSDALLTLADALREAARHMPGHFSARRHSLDLAAMLTMAAPYHADVPLPGPSQPAIPAGALRQAARELIAYGCAGSTGVASLLNQMADAMQRRLS